MRAILPVLLCLAACGSPVVLPPAIDAGSTTVTSYHRDIQPLLERSCTGCHKAGGIAPLAFDTPELAQSYATPMLMAIASKRMPPFYASADCNAYQHDPRLSAEETALVKAWVDEGAPLGNVADARHAELPPAIVVRPDVTMSIGADFDVRTMDGSLDNYRCFALDPKATTDLMVPAYEVIPGNVALVHHVLAYTVAPAQVAELEKLDADAPGPGYPCKQGGVGISGTVQNQIAGWVPGAMPTRLPAGTALKLPAGSRIVIQIHYNLNALSHEGVSPLDQTKLALETAAPNTLTQARILPMLKHNLDIPAFAPESVQVAELPAGLLYADATVYAVMGHMHQLGTRVKLERVAANGTTQCMLDVQNWDFNWQRTYELTTPIKLQKTDKLRITCTYDNSQPNQPYVNNVQQTSRNVTWGESSFDEMCMTYMTFTQ